MDLHKCKNCGHEFIPQKVKPKSGCLGTLVKTVFVAIILLLVLGWFFRDEIPERTSKPNQTMNIAFDSEKEFPKEEVVKAVPVQQHNPKPKPESIENSQDMSDTLSIKTTIRKAE